MEIFRKEITELNEYKLDVHSCRIKLNQNENPYELPAPVKEQILHRLASAEWGRYPPFVPRQQIEKVASFVNWKPEGVLIGNGSNELLQLLMTCLLERGRKIVISQPTFTLYKLLARSIGADVIEVPMLKPFSFDVDKIIESANAGKASMIVLCSPNNPTGTGLSRSALQKILDATDAVVVLDEAYIQFAQESLSSLLDENERLIVLQTFSKAMGAAGLRFGYLLANPLIAKNLAKVKLPYNVNIFTLFAVEVLIENWQTIRTAITTLIAERERVMSQMRTMQGIVIYPSSANFLLFEVLEKTPREIFEGMLANGILIRDVSSYPMLQRGLRVTIGTPEQNNEFLRVLKELL